MPRPPVRAIARSLGHDLYWGSPCTRGHNSQRRVSNGNCVKCEAENYARRNSNKTCKRCGVVFQGRWRCKTCSDECRDILRSQVKVASIQRKYQTVAGRFEINARSRIIKVVKRGRGRKSGSFKDLVGLQPAELMAYIESLFQPGVSWDNYGEWHLDHIRPCISFDLSDPVQQRECFHYSNLQPLWGKQNLVKRDRWEPYAQSI